MRGLLGFLRSRKNVVACLLALLGFALHLVGLLGAFWPLAVIVLYLAGLLLVPNPRRRQLPAAGFDPQEVRSAVDRAYEMTHGRLPADVQSKVAEIRSEILALLPHLDQFPLGSEDLFVIRRTATDYLPTTIKTYLSLPAAYATSRTVREGKTPLDLLKDQLELIDSEMDEITEAVHQRDSERLLTHGRFLEERFGRQTELELPPPP